MNLISAIICTYNRSEYLKKAIDSLLNQSLSKDKYEIIIVDNCCTDNTMELVLSYKKIYNNIKYIYESEAGVSVARNTGTKLSQAPLIAYLDDDAVAENSWLKTITELFQESNADVALIGGPISIIWETEIPDWLDPSLHVYLGKLDYGETHQILFPEKTPVFEGNMAIRKNYFELVNGFDTALGPKGKLFLTNEGVHLQQKIIEKKGKILFSANMKIQHHAKKSVIYKKWFENRVLSNGYSNGKTFKILNKKILPVLGREFKSLFYFGFRYYFNTAKRNKSENSLFHLKLNFQYKLGYIKGLIKSV